MLPTGIEWSSEGDFPSSEAKRNKQGGTEWKVGVLQGVYMCVCVCVCVK